MLLPLILSYEFLKFFHLLMYFCFSIVSSMPLLKIVLFKLIIIEFSRLPVIILFLFIFLIIILFSFGLIIQNLICLINLFNFRILSFIFIWMKGFCKFIIGILNLLCFCFWINLKNFIIIF